MCPSYGLASDPSLVDLFSEKHPVFVLIRNVKKELACYVCMASTFFRAVFRDIKCYFGTWKELLFLFTAILSFRMLYKDVVNEGT
jgi:hypothetical protein